MKTQYWSTSKFADRLRGTSKIQYGTSQEWETWHITAKNARPWRYWLAETALDNVQSVIIWPKDQIYNLKYWINNQFITKTHALTSSNLTRGQWHEFDARLLYCMFDELVNFVEVDLAWAAIRFDKTLAEKYSAPWYATGWFRWRTWRSAQAGLDYLDWESTLTYDADMCDPEDPAYGQLTKQATSAIEIKELYHWWTKIRPNRADPYKGWSELFSNTTALSLSEKSPEQTKQAIDSISQIEQQYFDEDTQMMHRLINIRSSIWT